MRYRALHLGDDANAAMRIHSNVMAMSRSFLCSPDAAIASSLAPTTESCCAFHFLEVSLSCHWVRPLCLCVCTASHIHERLYTCFCDFAAATVSIPAGGDYGKAGKSSCSAWLKCNARRDSCVGTCAPSWAAEFSENKTIHTQQAAHTRQGEMGPDPGDIERERVCMDVRVNSAAMT